MKTIICAVDFTPESLHAVNYAADMALFTHCSLLLLHACPYPVVVAEAPIPVYSMDELVADAALRLEEIKQKLIQRTNGQVPVKTLVKEGDAVENIKACSAAPNTYGVIMGRNNTTAFTRFFVGSTSLSAIRALECPLIILPPGAVFSGIREIGLASDFREIIDTLPAREIKQLVHDLNGHLHVIHVNRESPGDIDQDIVEQSGWLQELLSDLHPDYHFIRSNEPEREIIAYADQHKLDLLILIPKNHHFLDRLIHHSHSKSLVLHAHIPVLSLHE